MLAISLENISKSYRLGQIGSGTFYRDFERWLAKVRGQPDPYARIDQVRGSREGEQIWALRDVTFDVRQGEVLGIIGHNGAGKSTLLKILSQVTAPTSGQIKVRGRIASLLEVGTGFHPELTGRENIYLNGAILGMTREEVRRKFDEIVDFSGVEQFIDTPVKRYSSGMYVRLAFAVAAHLEPEILVIDEVLAVGDADFQKKCLGKMGEVAKGGRTVLFVSHNMQAVSSLTHQCALMSGGGLRLIGETGSVISKYLSERQNSSLTYSADPSPIAPRITNVELSTSEPNNVQVFGQPLTLSFEIQTPRPINGAALSFQVMNSHQNPIIHILALDSEHSFCRTEGRHRISCVIPKLRLYIGRYSLTVHFAEKNQRQKFETIEGICPFEVVPFGQMRDYYWRPGTSAYIEDYSWEVEEIQSPANTE